MNVGKFRERGAIRPGIKHLLGGRTLTRTRTHTHTHTGAHVPLLLLPAPLRTLFRPR